MPTEALVLPSASWLPPEPGRLFARLKENLEKAGGLVLAAVSIDEQVKQSAKVALEFSAGFLDGNNLKRNQEDRLKYFVARTNEEAAEKSAEGHEFPLKTNKMQFETMEGYIRFRTDYPLKGEYDPKFSRLIINLEAIEKDHEGNDKAKEACIMLTSIHETLHHVAKFESTYRTGSYRFDIYWYIEAVDELVAREILAQKYPKLADSVECQSYSDMLELAKKFQDLVGKEALFRSYLNGRFAKNELNHAGVNDKEIENVLRLGHDMLRSSPSRRARLYKQLGNYLDDLIRRKQAREYARQNRGKPGMSPETIEAAKLMLPEKDREAAPRLVLGACLYYKLQERSEPRAEIIFEAILDRYAANEGIVAGTLNDLFSDATKGLREELPPDIRASGMAGEKGDVMDYREIRLVEGAAASQMLDNGGTIPDWNAIKGTIGAASDRIVAKEGLVGDAAMLATEIISDTCSMLRTDAATEQRDAIRGIAREATAHVADGVAMEQGFLEKQYGEETRAVVAGVLDATEEFKGYGFVVADRCEELYSVLGGSPTCGDIIGVAALSAGMSEQASLDRYWEIAENFPEAEINHKADGALDMLGALTEGAKAENIARAFRTSVDQPAIPQYWESRDQKPVAGVIAASEVFASVLRVEQPAEKVAFDRNSLVVAIGADGELKKPGENRLVEALRIFGASEGIADPSGKMRAVGVSEELLRIIRDSAEGGKLTGSGDIMDVPQQGKDIADKIRSEYQEPIDRLSALFEVMRNGGKLGIEGSMFIEDRKGGSRSVKEVFAAKKANCLELTLAYLSVAERAFDDKDGVRIFPLDVINIQQRVEIGHVCVGVLIDDPTVSGHPDFNFDKRFRGKVLEGTGVQDTPGLRLLVIDPVNSVFDYRFHRVRPLDGKKVLSYFHSNSAVYAEMRGEEDEAERQYAAAEGMWPENSSVVNHYVEAAYDTDQQKALDMLDRIEPGYRTASYYRGMARAYAKTGDERTALAYLDRAIRMDRTDSYSLFMKGVIHLKEETREGYERAEAALSQATEILRTKRARSTELHRRAGMKGKMLDMNVESGKILSTQGHLCGASQYLAIAQLCQGKVSDAYQTTGRALTVVRQNEGLMELKTLLLLASAWLDKRKGDGEGWKARMTEAASVSDSLDSGEDGRFQASMLAAYARRVIGPVERPDEPFFRVNSEDGQTPFPEAIMNVSGKPLPTCGEIAMLYLYFATDGYLIIEPERWEERAAANDRPGKGPAKLRLTERKDLIDRALSAEGRMNPEALKTAMAEEAKKARRVLGIAESGLSDEEKAFLMHMTLMMNETELEVFTALNYVYLMAKHGKVPDAAYDRLRDDLIRKARQTGRFPKDDVVALAKHCLGDGLYLEEKDRLRKLFEDEPLAIDAKMIRTILPYARANKVSEKEVEELTRKYLLTLGQAATEQNMSRMLPKMRKLLASRLPLIAKYSLIDPNSRKIK